LSDPLVNEDFPGSLADSPTPNASETRSGNIEDLWLQQSIYLNGLKTSVSFIRALQCITLDDPMLGMSDKVLKRLQNPLCNNPSLSIDDDTRLVIRMFMDNPSEETYEKNCRSILLHPCMADASLPSYYRTKHLVVDLMGIKSVIHHMCINSCLAYTSPFSELEICLLCSEPWYNQFKLQSSSGSAKIPWQEFHTISIGPQLQALYQDPESTTHVHYLHKERSHVLSEIDLKGYLDEYSDVLHGTEMIDAFQDGRIGPDDIVLMFSIDGTQLYAQKLSSC
jgi:hypothetical protein